MRASRPTDGAEKFVHSKLCGGGKPPPYGGVEKRVRVGEYAPYPPQAVHLPQGEGFKGAAECF